RHGRVRRDHHLRLQYSGRDADAADADLHLHASSGRRGRRAQADLDLARHLALGDPRLGMDRASRQPPRAGVTATKNTKPGSGRRPLPGFPHVTAFAGSRYGLMATPQGSRPTGTDFSAFCDSTSITVKSLVRPLAT